VIKASFLMSDCHFKFFKAPVLTSPLQILLIILPFGYYSWCSRSFSFNQSRSLSFVKISWIIRWPYL